VPKTADVASLAALLKTFVPTVSAYGYSVEWTGITGHLISGAGGEAVWANTEQGNLERIASRDAGTQGYPQLSLRRAQLIKSCLDNYAPRMAQCYNITYPGVEDAHA